MEKLEKYLIYIVILFPIFAVLGNIVPPIAGIKINIAYSGLIMLFAFIVLFVKKRFNYILPFFIIIIIHFIAGIPLNLIEISALYSSIFVLLALPINKNLSNHIFNFFLTFALMPLTIALLQIFKIIPLSFGELKFISGTIWENDLVLRPNGFLYGVYELSILTILAIITLYYKKYKNIFNQLIFLSVASIFIYQLKLRASLILWFLFLLLETYQLFKQRSVKYLIYPLSIFLIIFLFKENSEEIYNTLQIGKLKSTSDFGQFMTGRINIWIVLIDAFSNADLINKIFGFGNDYSKIFMRSMLWEIDYVPGPHNSILEFLITNGIFGLLYLSYLIKKFFDSLDFNKTNKRKILIIFLLFLFTLGMTGPLLSNLFFGIGFYFLTKAFYQSNK